MNLSAELPLRVYHYLLPPAFEFRIGQSRGDRALGNKSGASTSMALRAVSKAVRIEFLPLLFNRITVAVVYEANRKSLIPRLSPLATDRIKSLEWKRNWRTWSFGDGGLPLMLSHIATKFPAVEVLTLNLQDGAFHYSSVWLAQVFGWQMLALDGGGGEETIDISASIFVDSGRDSMCDDDGTIVTKDGEGARQG